MESLIIGILRVSLHLTLLSVQRHQSRGTGGLKLLLRGILQHTSSFVKRFVFLANMYHYV